MAAVFGARKRYVKLTNHFREFLAVPDFFVLWPFCQVEHELVVLVKLQEFLRSAPRFLAHEWTKRDAVLESFALVNGDDPDRIFITFQTQFVLFPHFAAGRDLSRQPLDQSINAEAVFRACGVQQFDQMQNVRQSTFAVPPLKQT